MLSHRSISLYLLPVCGESDPGDSPCARRALDGDWTRGTESHMVTDPSSQPVRSGREEREEGKRRECIGGEGGEREDGGREEEGQMGGGRRGRKRGGGEGREMGKREEESGGSG